MTTTHESAWAGGQPDQGQVDDVLGQGNYNQAGQSGISREIAYSRGTNKFDAFPEQRTLPDFAAFQRAVLEDRAPAKGKQYVTNAMSLDTDGSPHRCNANALPRRWVPFDFDGFRDAEAFAETITYLHKYRGFCYTTASHTPEAPRARAILEASRPMDADEGRAVCLALEARIAAAVGEGEIRFDRSVYGPAQALYCPPTDAEVYVFNGKPVDVDVLLAEAPAEARTGTGHREGATPAETPTETQISELRDALLVLDADDRQAWIDVAHDLYPSGDIGFQVWDEWGQRSDKYVAKDAVRTWASCSGSHSGFKAVFARARGLGWKPTARPDAEAQGAPPHHDTPPPDDPPPDDPPPSDDQAEFARLAGLSAAEYDRERVAAAAALGIRVGTLDEEVKARRAQADKADETSLVEELEPWHEPVGGEILDDIRASLGAHVIADPEALDGVALWILGSFVYARFALWPKLLLSSPERRCGKTTMLEVIEAHCCRGLVASSITASAIFRVIDKSTPTLIIDEADRLPKDNEELTGIINCGHTRRGAFVIRTVKAGDDFDVRRFSVFAPMVLAAIGTLADTIMDRSIVIPMRRKALGESAHKVPVDLFERRQTARQMALRWAADNADALREAQVQVPIHTNDRARDNWHPLLKIAAVVGGGWPGRARLAFHKLTVEEEGDEAGPMLLADIREVFEGKGMVGKLASQTIVDALTAMEDRPWAEWRRGKPMTQNSLARLLRPYKIRPDNIRIGATVPKGYTAAQFHDAWARYTPSSLDTPFQTATPPHSSNAKGFDDFQTATDPHGVADRKPPDPLQDNGCSSVADEKGVQEGVRGYPDIGDDEEGF